MQTENKSISNNSIHFIQLKLFDFMDGKPNFNETLTKRLNQETSLSNDYSLELDENNELSVTIDVHDFETRKKIAPIPSSTKTENLRLSHPKSTVQSSL